MKNSIPVFDLCTLNREVGRKQLHREVVGGEFADYLKYRQQLLVAHGHDFYHVLLFTQGSGTQTIDFDQFDILPGQIYFMIPGQVHRWDFREPIDGYVVNFSENLFSSFSTNPLYLDQFRFLRGIPKDSVIDLEGEALEEAIHFFRQAIGEINKKDLFSLEMVCFALMSLFVSISRRNLIPVTTNSPEQKIMTLFNFRKFVNQYFAEKKMPREYAELLNITPNHLNALCNELLGKSAGQVIRERILLEAKKLLINADLSISEIAFQLNFTDNSYFSKFFKKYAGASPDEFRKKNRDNQKN